MKNQLITFSPLIVGCMRLGTWGVNMTTKALEAFVEECLALGLNDFDHADIYGHYTTEEAFGKLLKLRPELRSKIQITTKCGIRLTSENRPAHTINSYDSSKDHIITSAENSLRFLATDYLDVLLIHRPDFLMNPHEIAEAFEQLKSAGKVKHFGVSNFTKDQFDLLNSLIPLVTNQIEISITHLNAFTDGTLLQCQQHNIAPTAWSPLGGGAVFGQSEDEKIQRIQEMGHTLAEKYEVDLDEILMVWLLKHPAGIIPVIGTSKIKRVQSALNATKIEMSKEDWYRLWKASTGREID
ncbi:MAG: aldo/keto reductase [Bacteroidota bacterium]